ncbi:MAG: hypothetical protein RLZZ301_1557 [Bacteroidota bacterium]|jgi:hypothetical protein
MENKLRFTCCLLAIHFMSFSQNYIVFINGYRGPKLDHEITDNQIRNTDKTGYWYALDDTIAKRFAHATPLYVDAHHPLRTSVHKTLGRAVRSYLLSRFCWVRKTSRWVLNKNQNPAGFQERVANGYIAGQNLLKIIHPDSLVSIHFVCHSMGYAYMLGMIDALQGKVVFGKALILSPEGADVQGRDWQQFKEVWQYGCDADHPKAPPIFRQDGIAPQHPVAGIENAPGGRIYIPATYPQHRLGFIKSHHLAFYQWFEWIEPTDFGYFCE